MKLLKKIITIGAVCAMLQGCGVSLNLDTAMDSVSKLGNVIESVVNLYENVKGTYEELINTTTPENVSTVYDIPEFAGVPYVVINDNIPEFTSEELEAEPYEVYSELDYLGRCGMAMAMIDRSMMPTEERGSIGQVKPAGWHTVKYDCVDGMYLYNRCHTLGFQLTGENLVLDKDGRAKNLFTGTRYLNVEGMLPFENMVADYIEESGDRVLYKVTPLYTGNNLIPDGVQMQAWSVGDGGQEICFNVFCYNAQPGIIIDYATGESVEE